MDSSVLGTGRLVLNKGNSAYRRLQGTLPLPPGGARGGFTVPGLSSCIINGGSVRIDAFGQFFTFQWAPPSSGPADLPLVYTYFSDNALATELGSNWSGPYHRFAEEQSTVNPPPVNVNTPPYTYSYATNGSTYTTVAPSQNTLVGNSTTGWTETQPNGTAFVYDDTGVLRSIRNRAGVRWTLTWDSGFNLVQSINGPFSRRTSFAYDSSSHLRRIQDPGGRITTVTVSASGNLTRIISPGLCITSFVYSSANTLLAWVNPLGDRTTFLYGNGESLFSGIQQPMGQRITHAFLLSMPVTKMLINPRGAQTTLVDTNPKNWTTQDPFGALTHYKWDTSFSQQLVAVQDARGNLTSFTYQLLNNGAYSLAAARKASFISSTGQGQYSYLYNSNNQVNALVDELGNRSTLVRDSLGNRIAVVDPFNQRTSYHYDSMGRLTAVQNALGLRATQLYDSQGRRSVDINPLGQRTSYAYDVNSQRLRTQDPLGHITTTLHDAMNRLTVQVDPLGHRTSFSYDANGRLVRSTNPIGAITTRLYDLNSRLVATIDPLGLRTSFGYDATSNLIRTINPLGQINTSVFDLGNRLTAQIDALGNRTSFGYDVAWNPLRTINPLGAITTSVFDTTNRLVATIDALGNRNSISYDFADNPIRTTNPLGFITTGVFDKLLRPVASIDPLLHRTTTVFDAANRPIRVQDANTNITSTIYDKASRVTGMLNANGFRTTQVFDAANRRIALVDANAHRNSFVFDADSRQTQLIDPLGHRTTYGFDAASRQTLRIDARGFRTSYVYDNDNRLLGQHYPDGSWVTFAYDNASRRTLLNDATGRTTSMFDADGRLSVVINPAGLRLTYAYDAASQRKYLFEPEGARFTYAFDAAGRTSFVTNPQAQRATWSYDAASRVTGIHYANTTRTSYLYDNASRLLRVANLSSTSTTLSSFSYALDPVGNRLRVVESSGNRVTWSYDKAYQLKNEQRSGSNGYNITYTYDPTGNRLALINGGVRTTSTYNAANELSRSQVVAGITTYTSDAAGNLLTSRSPTIQLTTNTWDFENRLTQVALPSGIVDTFTYNGDGQRVQKIDSTGTTKHVWDGQNILLETDGSNIIQVVYSLKPMLYGNLISQRRSGITSFYLFDGLGSTTQLVNSTGSVTDSYLYDSFGSALLTSGSTVNPFRYVGRVGYYMDVDTAQYYLRARNYAAGIGRFLSRDRILIYRRGANLYSYCGNRPTAPTDPSGLAWWEWVPIVSTLGHTFADVPGDEIGDYNANCKPSAADCKFSQELAIKQCNDCINAQAITYLQQWFGFSTGADLSKGLAGLVASLFGTWAIKTGAKGAIGGTVTGGVLVIDATADALIVYERGTAIQVAADDAKDRYCTCC
jgi:RHS repeat-associated protein